MAEVYDIVLTYNTKDREQAQKIAGLLEDRALRVWYDEWALAPGADLDDIINTALHRTRTAAVLIGESGLGAYQSNEVSSLIKRGTRDCRIIPICLPAAQSEIPDGLKVLLPADITASVDENEIRKILRAVTRPPLLLEIHKKENHYYVLAQLGQEWIKLARDLKQEPSQAADKADLKEWKTIHAAAEELYREYRAFSQDLKFALESKKVAERRFWSQGCRDAVWEDHILQFESFQNSAFVLFRVTKPRIEKFSNQMRRLALFSRSPLVQHMAQLDKCNYALETCVPLKEAWGDPQFAWGCELAEKIGDWLLESLHIADLKLKKHFGVV